MARTVLLLLVFLLIGGTLGFFLAHVGNEKGDGPPEGVRAAGGGAAPTRSVAVTGETVPTTAPEPSNATGPGPAAGSAAAAPPEGTLDAIARSVTVPDLTGDGEITGRIQTADGKPVEGALVRAAAIPAREISMPRSDRPPEESLETAVRDAVVEFRRKRASRATARTDAEGRFKLIGIGKNPYRVQAWAEGYEIRARRANRVRAGDTLAFTARHVIWQQIRVVLPDGSPPPTAQIESKTERMTMRVDWSPDHPAVRLDPGHYSIRARTAAGLVSKPAEIRVRPNTPLPEIVLRLIARPSLIGRVLDESQVSRRRHVWLAKHTGGRPPDAVTLPKLGKGFMPREHDGFKFAYADLTPGTYFVGAGRHDNLAEVIRQVEVHDRPVTCDLEIPPPDARNYVLVRVLGIDGEPLTGIRRFRVRTRSPRAHRTSGRSPIATPDGAYWVPHAVVDTDAGDDVRHFVIAMTERYGEQEAEYVPGRDRDLTIRVTEPASLEVVVTGDLAALGPDASLALVRTEERHSYVTSGQPKSDGRFTFGPMQPGPYVVRIQVGDGVNTRPVARKEVVLRSGENRASLAAPTLYTLVVHIENGAGKRAWLQASGGRGGRGSRAQADKQGRLTFRLLPAGDYVLLGPSGERMRIRVPASGVVRFVGKAVNAMQVTVSDPAGALGRAGLRSGDLIIGANGKLFQDMGEIQVAMIQARSKPTRFTVQRGGRRFTVDLDTESWSDDTKRGGTFQPTTR